MKSFFGYGVQPITIKNGVVTLAKRRRRRFPVAGFGESGIKVREDPNAPWSPSSGMQLTNMPIIPVTTEPVPLSLAFTGNQVAEMFNVGPTIDFNSMNNPPIQTTPPPTPMNATATPTYRQYGPCPQDGTTFVTARSETEALAMCAAKGAASGGLGGDTMKYVLIGGAALVALLLLKK